MDREEIVSRSETLTEAIIGIVAHREYRFDLATRVLYRRLVGNADATRKEPSIYLLDDYHNSWRELVPEDPYIRAGILHQLAEKYVLTRSQIPNIVKNTSANTDAVKSAYKALFQTEIETAFSNSHEPEDSTAPESERRKVAEKLAFHRFSRGDVVVKQGDTVDRVFIVLDGELRSEIYDPSDPQSVISADLETGALIGDIALLTGEPYGATITAVRDSELASLSASDFWALAQQDAQLMKAITLQVIDRVRKLIRPGVRGQKTTIITILPISQNIDTFLNKLVEHLNPFGATRIICPADEEIMSQSDNDPDAFAASYDFQHLLHYHATQANYLVLIGDSNYPGWTEHIIDQATRVLLVGFQSDLKQPHPFAKLIADMPHAEYLPRTDAIILHEDRRQPNQGSRLYLKHLTKSGSLHIGVQHDPDYARIVRYIRGRAIGVVFGGGGMRGGAHLGVIKAMRELGIHADYAGGTSAGAIVAAQYGLEMDVENMLAVTKERLLRKEIVMQLTIPIVSLSSARALNEVYEEMFGGYDIEDLWTPVFTIASNLTQAEMRVMDRGSLHKAVRASTSLAGIHPPTIDTNNDLLIDGGGFDNTPADVMRQKVGNGSVIAVDLGFTKRPFPEFNYGDSISGFQILANRLNPFRKEKLNVPSITMIMMRANALWSIQMTSNQVQHADLVLKPPVSDYGLFDLEAADDLYEVGYRYGIEHLGRWLDAGGLEDTYPTENITA